MHPFVVKCSALGCLLSCVAVAGCTTVNPAKGFLRGQYEPKMEAEPDRWGGVGKEGRGNRPMEDEHDPLKPYLMSKEARDIERNLGYQ